LPKGSLSTFYKAYEYTALMHLKFYLLDMKYIQSLFISLLVFFSHAFAQPANDDCSGAIAISTSAFSSTCVTSTAATTLGATASTPSTTCGGLNDDDDIWYSFVAASQSAVIRISGALYIPSGTAAMSFEIYSGSCVAPTSLLCSSNLAFGNGYQIIDGLTIGNTYYIRFWTATKTNTANFNFCVQNVTAPPANDHCTNAIAITTQPFGITCAASVSVNTTGATKSLPNADCSSTDINDDVWYSFTANSASVVLRFSNGNYTTTIGVLSLGFALYNSACPINTTTIACSPFFGFGSGYQIIDGLTIGTIYRLRLFTLGPNNYGTFDFCVQDVPPPPVNDHCANAIPITTQPFGLTCTASVSVNTTGATKSSPNTDCSSTDINDDVWYSFTANSASVVVRFSNGNYITNTGVLSLGYALYNSTCPSTTATIACSSSFGFGNGYQIINGLIIGNTYYLRLFSLGPNNYCSFDFCVQDAPAPPVNNDCNAAIAVPLTVPGTTCFSSITANTSGATHSLPDPSCGVLESNDDIWYSFTASSPIVVLRFSDATFTTSVGVASLGYALYNSACPSTSATVSCSASFGFGAGSVALNGLTTGAVYYLRLYIAAANNYGSFKFCLQQQLQNDECNTATNIPVMNGFCTAPTISSLNGATTSAGFGMQSCTISSNSKDVWFKATIPTTGNLIVQTSAIKSTANDVVMSAHIGTCGTLTQIACDDNGNPETSPSANHSRITLVGRTVGEVIYFRVTPLFVNSEEPFAICAWDETTTVLPAIVPASNCAASTTVTIDSSQGNIYMWIPLMNNAGEIIAELYANGNNLGTVNSNVFIHTGAVRQQNDTFYLDRNISITATNNATIKARLYIKNTEVTTLKIADSTVSGIANLMLLNTANNCQSTLGNTPTALSTTYGTYGINYFLQSDFSSLKSFYVKTMCGPSITWTGNVSTDWKNPDNWSCGGVPWKYSNVIIPTGVLRYPIVPAYSEIKSLQVQNNASVIVSPGVLLKINGR
jgi:hypothetical protein